MNFASDNSGPAAPEVMDAVMAANAGYEGSYGADGPMERVRAMVREQFEHPEAEVYLVATGTAANAITLACLTAPTSRVYTHREAHTEVDECGAPVFYTGGAKLELIDGADGKIMPEGLRAAIEGTPQGFVHAQQRGAVSITNLSECGAAYTPAEVVDLCRIAAEYNLPVQMDGARFANALVGTNASPGDMTWRAGIKALSLGGTKNGCMGVEAVVLFDPSLAWAFELNRKRGGHLFSKHRYLSAQMEGYLADGTWLRLARQANDMAARLEAGILALPGAELMHPRDGNQVFARFARGVHRAAQAAGAQYYLWPHTETMEGPEDGLVSARFVTNWSTTADEVDAFLATLRG